MPSRLRLVSLVLIELMTAMMVVTEAGIFTAPPGLIIEEVVADSLAAKAGLKVGRRLLS